MHRAVIVGQETLPHKICRSATRHADKATRRRARGPLQKFYNATAICEHALKKHLLSFVCREKRRSMNDVPRAVHSPAFLSAPQYVEPQSAHRTGQWHRRKMQPDVLQALTPASLAKIHSEPRSADGKRITSIYNMIAFGAVYNSQFSASMTKKKRYGDLCRSAIAVLGIERKQFERDVHFLLERGVLHVKRGEDKRLSTSVFLSTATLREKSKSQRTTAAMSQDAKKDTTLAAESTFEPSKRYLLPQFLKEHRFRQPALPPGRKSW